MKKINIFRLYLFSRSLLNVQFLFIVSFGNGVMLYAQDSLHKTLSLPEVIITGSRQELFSPGSHVQETDSFRKELLNNSSLTELVAFTSPVFIKSYGSGSLATLSVRGGGSGHTSVLWNGINLQSPMNGNIDLSLIPSFFSDDIYIQYGGICALEGSGSLGGAIHLINRAQKPEVNEYGFHFTTGSFHSNYLGFSAVTSASKTATSSKVFWNTALNDFPFRNILEAGKPIERMANAALNQYGIFEEVWITTGKKHDLKLIWWYQFSDRQIPPTLTMLNNYSFQQDEFNRIMAEWKRKGKKTIFSIKYSFFDESLKFSDPLIALKSVSQSLTSVSEMEWKYFLNENSVIDAGIIIGNFSAISDNYENKKTLMRPGLFLAYKRFFLQKKLNTALSVREEAELFKAKPPTPAFSVSYRPGKYMTYRIEIARNYKLPTLNDLYWIPGGNPALKPENGWSNSAGIDFKKKTNNGTHIITINLFSNQINDWILWIPKSSTFWSPENVQAVWARGVEASDGISFYYGRLKIESNAYYSYTLSTIRKYAGSGADFIGRQLIYTPKHSALFRIQVGRNKFAAGYTHDIRGKRFTTSDNTEFLKAFNTGNIFLSFSLKKPDYDATLIFRANNIWNTDYQVIAWRPMPWGNFTIGINLKFLNHQNK